MKLLAKQNRELIMINAQNTQNENDAEKIILQVPEQYEDFNKKIVFVTPDGNVWDIITNNEYLIKKAITKYKQVDFYIWLTKGEVDFRSQTKTLKFYDNVDASDEITDEEIGRVNTVINLLEEEITKVENLETEIDGKLEEIDTAIDNVNTAIQEVENLNVDAEKVGQTTTITLTKKNGTTKVVHVDDGVDLQFMWQGTSLGIKTAEQQEYTFVDLQGVQGQRGEQGEPFTIKKTYSSVAEMNADFNNMQLGDYVMIASTVEVEDNAKLYTRGESQWIFITDFSGATGIRGETGLTPNIQIGTVTQGTSFNVTRTGTNENPVLNFTLVKGDKGDQGIQGIQGLTGNGISSITKTGTSGLVDTYTITYTNGNTTTFTITNGEDGEVTETELDVLRQKVANQQKVIDQLPQVTGQGTEVTLENTIEATFTKFDVEGNSTQETNLFDGQLSQGTLDSTGEEVDSVYRIRTTNYIEVVGGTTIPVRAQSSKEIQYLVYVFNNSKEVITTMGWNDINTSQTLQLNAKYIKLLFSHKDGSAISTSNVTNVVVGDVPNPNYEQPILSAGDNENILNPELAEDKKYQNIDGNYSISTHSIAWISGLQSIESSKNYVLNYQAQTGAFYDENRNVITTTSIYKKTTFQTPSNAKYVNLTFLPEVIAFADKNKIKLEKGNKASGYSPYGMGSINEKITNSDGTKEQDYSIFVQQPMRSIGDVRDCFVKKNSSWFERHYVLRLRILSNMSIESYNLGVNSYLINLENDCKYITDKIVSISNYFKGCSHDDRGTAGNHIIYPINNGHSLVLRNTEFSTLAELKAFFDNNEVYVDYILENPTDLPCTQSQINVLENLPSTYKDFTIIQSQDETPAYLEVSGIYDLNKLINN